MPFVAAKMLMMLNNKIKADTAVDRGSEDERAELRYRVYFMRSLVARLLFRSNRQAIVTKN
jgi:hypothetical protein